MSEKRPARDTIVTRRDDPIATTYFGCPNGRCPIRHWPIAAGDRCPSCDTQGYFRGTVARALPAAPPVGGDDEDGDG